MYTKKGQGCEHDAHFLDLQFFWSVDSCDIWGIAPETLVVAVNLPNHKKGVNLKNIMSINIVFFR
jgi:hypothetical protein